MDYGGSSQKEPDGATWKALGQECIDGAFYAFVSRQTYAFDNKDPFMRQTAANACLIKSTDRGRTWTRSAAENYRHPMWPGPRFSAQYFIHYGKNGGNVPQDAANRYVYAFSNNGFWMGGDDYILARIERPRIKNLQAADWTYFTGGGGQDAQSWSHEMGRAVPILKLPAHQCGSGPATYVPALGVYAMVTWYLPTTLEKWFEPTEVKYDFYQAEHPWGPWKFISSLSDRFLVGGHMYGPVLAAKFQERTGDGVRIALFTSGCPFDDVPQSLYKMWEIPLVLKTARSPPSTLINDDDPRIAYHGHWTAVTRKGWPYHHEDIHVTSTPGDWLEFSFTGTGIEYLTEKYHDLGQAEISIDGLPRQTVDLRTTNFPHRSGGGFRRLRSAARPAHDQDRQQEHGLRGYRCPACIRRRGERATVETRVCGAKNRIF